MENKNLNILEGRPQIDYPCEWEYRVIGENEDKIKEIVKNTIKKSYSIEIKNKSSKGKFTSFHVKTIVNDEKERNDIYSKLSGYGEIKMVI